MFLLREQEFAACHQHQYFGHVGRWTLGIAPIIQKIIPAHGTVCEATGAISD